LPLEHIKFNHSSVYLKPKPISASSVGIIQSLANHDPDVDAIYRLVQPLPFDFPGKTKSKSKQDKKLLGRCCTVFCFV
jgi:hypothetical protein